MKKGEFCGIAEYHSAVYLRGRTAQKYATYTVGKIASTDRKGERIKTALVSRYGTEIRLREDMSPRFWEHIRSAIRLCKPMLWRFMGRNLPASMNCAKQLNP